MEKGTNEAGVQVIQLTSRVMSPHRQPTRRSRLVWATLMSWYNDVYSLDMNMVEGEFTTREAWDKMFDADVTGTHNLTRTFEPLLQVTVPDQGRAPALADAVWCSPEMMGTTYGPGPPPPAEWCMGNAIGLDLDGYRSSKSPLNRMMLAWYWNLKNIGVKVWSVLSGSLATNLGGSGGSVDWGRADQKGD